MPVAFPYRTFLLEFHLYKCYFRANATQIKWCGLKLLAGARLPLMALVLRVQFYHSAGSSEPLQHTHPTVEYDRLPLGASYKQHPGTALCNEQLSTACILWSDTCLFGVRRLWEM